MVDFAKLTLEVDSRPVVQGTKALDEMAKASEKGEESVDGLGRVYGLLERQLSRANDQLATIANSQRTVASQYDQTATSANRLGNEQERALVALRGMTEEVQAQLDSIDQTNAERQAGITLVRAQALAQAAQTEEANTLLEVLERQTQLLQQQRGSRAVSNFIQTLEQELRLAKLSTSARAEELAVLQLSRIAREEGVELAEKELQAVRELARGLQAAQSAQKQGGALAATDIGLPTEEQGAAGIRVIEAVRTAITRLGGAIASVVTIRNVVNTSLDFQTALTAVAIGADLAAEEVVVLERGLLEMSRSLAVPTQELLRIAEATSGLGLKGVDDLLRFTEVGARLKGVSDFGGGEATKGLAQLLKITGEAPAEVERLASVILRVGGSTAATDKEVADLAIRLARATTEFRLGSTEAIAFAAALASVDIPANTSGSAIGRLAAAIRVSLNEGGSALEGITQLTRTSEESLRTLFSEDAAAAVVLLLQGLGKLAESGVEVEDALKQIGVTTPDVVQVVRGLSANTTLLGESLALARDEASKGNALLLQSEVAYGTTSASVAVLANTLRQSVIVQSGFRDAIKGVADVSGEAVTELLDLDRGQQQTSAGAKVLAAALGAAAANAAVFAGASGIRALLSLFPAFTATVLAHAAATSGAALATDVLVVSLKALRLAVVNNPLTATLVIVSSLAGAYFALSDSVDVSTGSLEDFNSEAERTEQRIQSIADSFASLERLRALRDSAVDMGEFGDAANLAQREIAILKEALVDVNELGDLSGTGRISVDRVRDLLGSNVSQELEQELQGIIAAAERFRQRDVARNLAESFGGVSDSLRDVVVNGLDPGSLELSTAQVVELVKKRLAELQRLQQEFDAEAERARSADREKFGAAPSRTTESDRALESLRSISKELNLQIQYVGDTNAAREQALFLARAQELADAAQTEEARQLLELIKLRSEELQQQRGQQAVDSFVDGLREEVRLAGLSTEAREEELAVLQLTKLAKEQGVDLIDDEVALVKELVQQLQAAQAARENQTDAPDSSDFSRGRRAGIEDQFASIKAELEEEVRLIGQTQEARERATFARQVETLAVQAEADGYKDLAASIREALPELNASFAELQRLQEIEQGADNVGNAFSRTFSSIIKGSQSASEGLKSLALNLSDLVFKNLALNPLAEGISAAVSGIGSGGFASLFAAKGAVFHAGQALSPGQAQSLLSQGVPGYADGGLIRSPIALSAPNGRGVIAGEAGEEAIVPLARMANGQLGVSSAGGGGGRPVVNNYVYNETIITPEPSSFRESSRQRRRSMDSAFKRGR